MFVVIILMRGQASNPKESTADCACPLCYPAAAGLQAG